MADAVKIGDFNGDGRADVFYASGTSWSISYGGNTNWVTVLYTTAR